MKFKEVSNTSIPEILKTYFDEASGNIVFVVVIGANNGDILDFLSGYLLNENTSGILIEPIGYLFNGLREKFKSNENLVFENSAIYKRNCRKNMYRVNKSAKLPDWITGLASFDKKIVDMHQADIGDPEKLVVKESVNCITFSQLLKKHKVDAINILQIDTEGYDYEIICSINFKQVRPDIIIFEYLHLTYYQCFALINLLEEHNYKVNRNIDSFDVIAIDNEIL